MVREKYLENENFSRSGKSQGIQWMALSSALIFAPGIYLSEYYLRCKYGCNRSLHFGAVGVQRTFP